VVNNTSHAQSDYDDYNYDNDNNYNDNRGDGVSRVLADEHADFIEKRKELIGKDVREACHLVGS